MIAWMTGVGKSLGCGDVNLYRTCGVASATALSKSANRAPGPDLSLYISPNPAAFTCSESTSTALLSQYEFTFYPSKVISLIPPSANLRTSSVMDKTERLRSLPRVNGTTQKLHMLLHPLIIDTYADSPLCRTGVMSEYVSSSES